MRRPSLSPPGRPLTLQEQAPGMVRPMWIGCYPGFYTEVQGWPNHLVVIIRRKSEKGQHVECSSMKDALAHLSRSFGGEVIVRKYKEV